MVRNTLSVYVVRADSLGNTAHIVYMGLCLINNIIAVANMLLGASAAITAL